MRASTAELEQLRESVGRFARDAVGSIVVRRAMDSDGHDEAVWQALARDLGLAAVGVPTAYGGAGYSFTEVGVVLEELARVLAPTPYLSSAALSTAALLTCADESARQDLLPGMADGTTVSTLAILEPGDMVDARPRGDGHALAGSVGFVMNAARADVLLVQASLDHGAQLFAVERTAPGVLLAKRDSMDVTRPLWRVTFRSAPARLLTSGGEDAATGIGALGSAVSSALACEQVGGAARCLDTAVAYARTRMQFGRPIGSFQAVKHRCADLLVAVEASRSMAYHARDLIASGAGARPARQAASAAKAWCSDTYVRAAQDSIQVHGGIGFTWEHEAHLHLRRARAGQLLGGSPRQHRRIVAKEMGL